MNTNKIIDYLILDKNKKVLLLINLIKNTNDYELRHKLIFTLVDNFKSPEITSALIELIKNPKFKEIQSTLIYACNQYSPKEFKLYLDFFTDLVINGDYEVSWNSAQLIMDFPEPYEWDEILLDKIENQLNNALNKKNDNIEFIRAVLDKIG